MDGIEKLKLNDEFNAWYNAEKVEENVEILLTQKVKLKRN